MGLVVGKWKDRVVDFTLLSVHSSPVRHGPVSFSPYGDGEEHGFV